MLFFLRQSTINPIHSALDELSAVPFGQRWSHPQMIKLRERGIEVVPYLRRVLREKNNPSIRFQLWVKAKWPGATKYYSHFPDANKLTERRSMACQVLQTLGPAGKAAVPEIIETFCGKDIGDLNSATMALHAIGIDAMTCERLGALMESNQGISESGCMQIIGALGEVKPPSPRTLRVLVASLTNSSTYVQYRAAEVLGTLRVRTPEIVVALKSLQANSTSELSVVTSSATLWEFEKDPALVLPPTFRVLQNLIEKPTIRPPGLGGDSGQGVTSPDQAFMAAAELFRRMNLGEPEKTKALAMLEAWSEKSGRIFVRMLLLPAMMNLGLPREKCVEICKAGLSRSEDYYRIHAARLLAYIGEKYPLDGIDLSALIRDADVGVRVYAAKAYWHKNSRAEVVVPVLIESLDRAKHQSYYYAETLPVALLVLAQIGPEAHAAMEPLERLLSDPNPKIVNLASNALAMVKK